MKPQTEIKIAGGVLGLYGLAILGYIGWLVSKAGLVEPMQLSGAGLIGLAFLAGGLGSFTMKKWGLYITGFSIIGAVLLAVTTSLIPGGVLPVLLLLAILWDVYKHRELLQ